MTINAANMHFRELNERVKACAGDVTIDNCAGQRYICAGAAGLSLTINGTPGNALGCYLNGAEIVVNGNAQDAVGDTMNDGTITVHGRAGDALGYAMRGGLIMVRGDSGYRTGIHMKQYKEHKPVVIVGGTAGSFLGEYQAGGLIAVLNLQGEEHIVGNFTGTGLHGGKIFLRTEALPPALPPQVAPKEADKNDLAELEPYLKKFAAAFGVDLAEITGSKFFVLEPNSKNPYKQLYTSH